ncbi:MAG: hypothetical protein ACK2UQ_02020, partial [Anaerolineae bacterium]
IFEINLTRLYSVAQFYHFAFMIISLAMLGFGASGAWLALFPRLGRNCPRRMLAWLACGYGVTSLGAYLALNWLPFDSFSIAWDRRQIMILVVQYISLSLPFLCSGAVLSLLFSIHPQTVGRIYAINLSGSALGCMLALLAPVWLGGEGVVWLSVAAGGGAALGFAWPDRRGMTLTSSPDHVVRSVAGVLVAGGLALLLLRPIKLDLRLSPYKGLSYALQFPGAQITSQQWNSFSRVDVVESPGIRSLPGLSYRYMDAPPPQRGLLVDGDDLNPILTLSPETASLDDLAFADYMPTSIAYQLKPDARILVLEPRGGLETWVALAQRVAHITAVEANPLIVAAAGDIYRTPRVTVVVEDPRSFVRRTASRYDVVTLALTTPYRPIRSGAYTLSEDYRYTIEAFRDYLHTLAPGGILVVTRWLQTPPSESLRAFALAVIAVEEVGGDPAQQIVAFRGYAALTLLIKTVPFTPVELDAIRHFVEENAFDMVYAPDIDAGEINRFNVLEEPEYYQTFTGLLAAEDRAAWYAAYPFDVTPPTDAHPFFGHFFKWSQVRQVWAELGKTWQPFGGAGYFVLVALLLLAVVAAAVVILLPVVALRRGGGMGHRAELTYFGLLGLGFMLVEVPLLQRFILFLGHPAYAMTTVLFAILFFSGIGSALSQRIGTRLALALLIGLIGVYAVGLPWLFARTLALPLSARMLVAVLALAPAGLLMGMPFPQGLRRLSALAAHPGLLLPWAWGINGALSVVASVLAALLALSFGFDVVLLCGALCYAGAWLVG